MQSGSGRINPPSPELNAYELIKTTKEIAEAELMIFEVMYSCIRTFMQCHHYDDDAIDEYLSYGLWIWVAHDTLTYFKG